MSDYETRVGKIKRIIPKDGWNTMDMVRWIIHDKELKIPNYYDEKDDNVIKDFFYGYFL